MKMKQAVSGILILAVLLTGCGAARQAAETGEDNGAVNGVSGGDLQAREGVSGGDPARQEKVFCGAGGLLTLTIPEGWEYEITAREEGAESSAGYDGIRFWPAGERGAVGLYYHYGGFGVCGTGLKQEEITLPGGRKAHMGTFDDHEVWDYMILDAEGEPEEDAATGESKTSGEPKTTGEPKTSGGPKTSGKPQEPQARGVYVAMSEGIEGWWKEYEEEALEILGSAGFPGDRTAAATDFALRLFRECLGEQPEGENVLISPLSVFEALAMAANGARGDTLEQMEKTLGVSSGDLDLYSDLQMGGQPREEDGQLHAANAIWLMENADFIMNDEFEERNREDHGADIRRIPFDDAAPDRINAWVEEQTDGMIPKILDVISPGASMYLVNALAFEAQWQEQYREWNLRDGVFLPEDGSAQDVKLMYSTEHAYLQDENAKGFIKYYEGGQYAFAALLPNEGISVTEYLDSLDGGSLHRMLCNPVKEDVYAAVPEYEAEYSVSLEKILSRMGMEDAFDASKADFSGMGSFAPDSLSSRSPLYLNRALHKACISVDPKGTKAAAATVLEVQNDGIKRDAYEVCLNRPFIYIIC